MAYDGNGTFSLTYTWATEAASPPIAISKLDTEFAAIATGLSLCVLRNGNGVPTANTPWNDKKITGLADATADTDALNRQTADARYALASSGSFTLYLRATDGGADLASGTAYWKKAGDVVNLYIPAGLSVSTSSTTLLLQGLPSAAQPEYGINPQFLIRGYNAGSWDTLVAQVVGAVDYITLRVGASAAAFSGTTSVKGIGAATCLSYLTAT